MNNNKPNLPTNNPLIPSILQQSTPTYNSIQPIKAKKPKELFLSDLQNINKFIKTNPHTQSKLHVYPETFQPNIRKNVLLNKISHIFQHEKLITSLQYTIQPQTASETAFTLSKLKDLHHLTSLDLSLFSTTFCTPYFLKSLSIILSRFKQLTSFRFAFPFDFDLFPQLFSSLFFALPRLNSLKNLSLHFDYVTSSNNPSWLITLASCLKKLAHLKSLNLTFGSCFSIGDSVLSSLAPVFKGLSSLETLNIYLSDFDSLRNDDILTFFASLKESKSLKNLALSFENSQIDTTNPEPISKGLSLLNPSQLKSLKLKYYSDIDDDISEQLAIALQRFSSLQELALDLSGDYMISDEGLNKLAASIQTLQSLCSLNIKVFEASQLINSVKIIGNMVKSLAHLTDLELDFTQQIGVDDLQLISFSENLKNLTNLKRLSLGLSQLEEITDNGLMALSESLGHLPNLESLRLGLVNMKMLSNNGILKFSLALKSLNHLKSLSLNMPGNQDFEEEEGR